MKNRYIFKDDIVIILINSIYGLFNVIVDLEDFDKVNQFKTSWTVCYRHNRVETVLTKVQHNKIRYTILLHRLIMNCSENMVIDHIDRNPLNNRKSNLRIVTLNENKTNLSDYHNSQTKHKNIYLELGKYSVRIKKVRYGSYDTLDEALKVRNELLPKIFPLRNLDGYVRR